MKPPKSDDVRLCGDLWDAVAHLTDLRRRRGYTQKFVGQICDVGQSRMASFEAGEGKQGPTWPTLVRVAAAYGLEPVVGFQAITPDSIGDR